MTTTNQDKVQPEPAQSETDVIRKTRLRSWVWGVILASSSLALLATGPAVFLDVGLYFTIVIAAIAVNVGLLGASLIRAGNALNKELARQPGEMPQVLAVLPHFAPPFVGQIVATALVGVMVAMVIAMGMTSMTLARIKGQKADLQNVQSLQNTYMLTDHNGDGRPDSIYADGLSKLPPFEPGPGVHLHITHGSREGWAAISSTEALSRQKGCAIFIGNVPDTPTTLGGIRAEEPGRVFCDH